MTQLSEHRDLWALLFSVAVVGIVWALVEVRSLFVYAKGLELDRDAAQALHSERAAVVVAQANEIEGLKTAKRNLIRDSQSKSLANVTIGNHLDEARGRMLELEGALSESVNKGLAWQRERDKAQACADDRLEAIHVGAAQYQTLKAERDASSARAMDYARKVDQLERHVAELEAAAVALAGASDGGWNAEKVALEARLTKNSTEIFSKNTRILALEKTVHELRMENERERKKGWDAVTMNRKPKLDVLEALDESARLCDADEAQEAAELKAKQQAAADRKEVVRLNAVVVELNGEIQKLKKGIRDETKLRTDAQAIYDAKESDFQANMAELRGTISRQRKRVDELTQGGDTVSMASVRADLARCRDEVARLTTARDEAQAKADRLRTELEGVGEHTNRIIDQRNEAREGCKKLKAQWEDLAKQLDEANRNLMICRNRLELIDRVAVHGFNEEAKAPVAEQPGFGPRTYTLGPALGSARTAPRQRPGYFVHGFIQGNGPLIDGEKS